MSDIDPLNDPIEAQQQSAQLDADLSGLVDRLTRLASEQVSKKVEIEDRWIKDLRQYHGKYDPDVESALITDKKSRLFINETRAKTHAWEARLSDMLFPTDDDNWGIRPTPSPELMGAASLITPGSEDAQALRQIQDLAKAKAKAMHGEIKDQLVQAQYNIKCRQIIHEACKMGSGIMKGPVIDNRIRRKYEEGEERDDGGNIIALDTGAPQRTWKLSEGQDPRPGWEHVDPFNYFPDMSAANVDEKEFDFERHLMTKKQVRALSRRPGFDKTAIREMLLGSPQDQTPDYVTKLRDISGTAQSSLPDKYLIWEYHGPIEARELRAIAMLRMTGQVQFDAMEDIENADPLQEIQAVVWFSEHRLLKYGPPLLETGDSIYSVFSFEKDYTSIFGFGVPFLLRDSQAAMNAGWRMTMDNAGLSVGPQIVVNRNLVEPVNGIWDLEPRKVWLRTRDLPYPTNAFEAFHIDSRQVELANIIQMAKSFADDESNMPMIAQGEQGAGTRTTGMGMSMLMNSVNVVFRRVVKMFDDDMTIPNLRRAYDWNMAFSQKSNIKGDFEVDARGSSVLLVRELQAQNLMTMVSSFASHPVLGPLSKVPQMYRKLVQAHMLPADELVKTDDELQVEETERQSNPPPPDPEILKLEAQYNIAQLQSDADLKIAQLKHETAMMTLAEKRNMTVEQLQAKILVARETNQSSERKLAADIAMAKRDPSKTTGGTV